MRRSFLFVLSQSVNESNCQSLSRLMFLYLLKCEFLIHEKIHSQYGLAMMDTKVLGISKQLILL